MARITLLLFCLFPFWSMGGVDTLSFDHAPVEMVHSYARTTVSGIECGGTGYYQKYRMVARREFILESFPYLQEGKGMDQLKARWVKFSKGETIVIIISGSSGSSSPYCDNFHVQLNDAEPDVEVTHQKKDDVTTINIRVHGSLNNQNEGRYIRYHLGINGYTSPLPEFTKIDYIAMP